MTELEQVITLANKILDRPSADPDDDYARLARQFLRSREQVTRLQEMLLSLVTLTTEIIERLPDDWPNVDRALEVFTKLKLAIAPKGTPQ